MAIRKDLCYVNHTGEGLVGRTGRRPTGGAERRSSITQIKR